MLAGVLNLLLAELETRLTRTLDHLQQGQVGEQPNTEKPNGEKPNGDKPNGDKPKSAPGKEGQEALSGQGAVGKRESPEVPVRSGNEGMERGWVHLPMMQAMASLLELRDKQRS
jgi:hypothetical protein